MAFCKFCGKEIPEGAQCDCAESQAAANQAEKAPESTPVPAADTAPETVAEKPSGKAAIVLIAALVIVLVIIISLISSIAGGGYKKPVNNFVKALNKSDGKLMVECLCTDDILDDYDKDDFEDMDKILDWLVEMCEEKVGKNVKFSIDIEDKEKLKKSELKELEEDYEDEYDAEIDVTKAYELDCVLKIKGKKDKVEEDITVTVMKVKGEGWLLSTSAMDSFF